MCDRKDIISLNPRPNVRREYRCDLYCALTDIAFLRPINKRSEQVQLCGQATIRDDYLHAHVHYNHYYSTRVCLVTNVYSATYNLNVNLIVVAIATRCTIEIALIVYSMCVDTSIVSFYLRL